jgi:hypothetical protein
MTARLLTFAYLHPNLMLGIVAAAVLFSVAWCQDPIDRYK